MKSPRHIGRAALVAASGLSFSTFACFASPAHAGDDTSSTILAPVVVTATRTQAPLADSIPQTTLFDAQDIANLNAPDALGLLAPAPGVQITRNGGLGASSGVYIRGATST